MNDNVTTTHLLACTKEQLQLIYDLLLRQSLSDEEGALASSLAANIAKAGYCSCGLFLSRYVCERCYGEPAEYGWYAQNVDCCWSEYFEDIGELLEHLNQCLIDEDAMPKVFEAIPKKEQILNYMLAGEDESGEMSARSICVAVVAEYAVGSSTTHTMYVVEFQPGVEQTNEWEVCC